MSLIGWLYLIDVTDGLKVFFTLCGVIGGIALLNTLSVGGSMNSENGGTPKEWRVWRWWVAGSSVAFLVGTFCSLATPSKQTLYLMLGVKTANEIVDNPAVRETGSKVMNLINQKLDEMATKVEEKKQ